MTKQCALAAAAGLIAASAVSAQFQIGSTFGSAPMRATPIYVDNPYYYDAGYYDPGYYGAGYYDPAPSYYSPGVTYYAEPGISVGAGRPYWGGYNGGWNRGYYGNGRAYWGNRRWRR